MEWTTAPRGLVRIIAPGAQPLPEQAEALQFRGDPVRGGLRVVRASRGAQRVYLTGWNAGWERGERGPRLAASSGARTEP